MAFTLVLLVGAGLLGERLLTLLPAEPGFPTTGLLVVSATFPPPPPDDSMRRSQEVREVVEPARRAATIEPAAALREP